MNALDHRSFDDGGDDLQLAVAVRAVLDIPANRHNTDRQRLRGLPAYALPELLITGFFSQWPVL